MNYLHVIGLCATLAILTGCSDKNEVAVRDPIRELSEGFDRHFNIMVTNANVKGHELANKLMQDLLALPNVEDRKRLFGEWRKKALTFDYNALPLIHNDPCRGRSFSMMKNLFMSVFPLAAETEEEKWAIRIEYLGWFRKTVQELAPKRGYPKGVYVVNGNRLKAEGGSRKEFEEYKDWLNNYNWNSMRYENELSWMEIQFHAAAKDMDAETRERIAALIENFMGRKLRTQKECENDAYGKRRVVFPNYVPTSTGLKEEWVGEFCQL